MHFSEKEQAAEVEAGRTVGSSDVDTAMEDGRVKGTPSASSSDRHSGDAAPRNLQGVAIHEIFGENEGEPVVKVPSHMICFAQPALTSDLPALHLRRWAVIG